MSLQETYEAIVIGTSAGGLFALTSILNGLPENYPIPIIVVQHRIKDQGTLLEEVLQQKCRIRIKQADEKENIVAGTVYFAPPDYHLQVEENRTLSLAYDEPVLFSRPSINVLFESAAVVYRSRLIGILLTGASHDGSNGLQTIAKYGGKTIVQDPREARFPLMPQRAIETSRVDNIWKLSEIQKYLLTLINSYEK